MDQCKITLVYSKCCGHSYQPLYFTLDYNTILNKKPYFSFVNDSAIEQINLKKEI
jgi:hypothetical protein